MNLEELMNCISQAKRDDKAYAANARNPGLFMGEWVHDVEAAQGTWDKLSEQIK